MSAQQSSVQTLSDQWSRRILGTLLRRYEIRPYRYKGQRRTTVNARVPASFVEETLWPQFEQFNEILQGYLSEVTGRVVAQVLQAEGSEADEVEKPRQLSLPETDTGATPEPAPQLVALQSRSSAPADTGSAEHPASVQGDRNRRKRDRKKRRR